MANYLVSNHALRKWDEPMPNKAPLPDWMAEEYGTHLIQAWYYLRDRELFIDPDQKTSDQRRMEAFKLEADYLQLQLLEWMKYKK